MNRKNLLFVAVLLFILGIAVLGISQLIFEKLELYNNTSLILNHEGVESKSYFIPSGKTVNIFLTTETTANITYSVYPSSRSINESIIFYNGKISTYFPFFTTIVGDVYHFLLTNNGGLTEFKLYKIYYNDEQDLLLARIIGIILIILGILTLIYIKTNL